MTVPATKHAITPGTKWWRCAPPTEPLRQPRALPIRVYARATTNVTKNDNNKKNNGSRPAAKMYRWYPGTAWNRSTTASSPSSPDPDHRRLLLILGKPLDRLRLLTLGIVRRVGHRCPESLADGRGRISNARRKLQAPELWVLPASGGRAPQNGRVSVGLVLAEGRASLPDASGRRGLDLLRGNVSSVPAGHRLHRRDRESYRLPRLMWRAVRCSVMHTNASCSLAGSRARRAVLSADA
jgi:hypothetical protein